MEALKVLVIEDDELISMLLREILEDLGHHVCATVATEEDAVLVADRCKPDLMIVDEHLRQGTGASAVERILLNRSIPYVFISGAHVHGARQGAKVLRKPFLLQDLARAIQDCVTDVPVFPD